MMICGNTTQQQLKTVAFIEGESEVSWCDAMIRKEVVIVVVVVVVVVRWGIPPFTIFINTKVLLFVC